MLEREGGKWVKFLLIISLDFLEYFEIIFYLFIYCFCGFLEEFLGFSIGFGRCVDTINIVEWKEGRMENGRK